MSVESDIKAAFTAGTLGGGGGISPETAEKFAAEMKARGIDPSAALARHGVGVDQSKQPSTETAPVTPQRYAPDLDTSGLPRLTPAQVEQAAATLRQFFTGDLKALEAELAKAGEAPVTETAPDTRTEAEKEFDASSLAPPVDPASYDLNGLWVGREQTDGQYDLGGLPEIDRSLRQSMSELSVPKVLGQATAEAFADSASAWSKLAAKGDDLAAQQWHLEQSALFARVAKIGWQQAAEQMRPFMAKLSAETREFLMKSGSLEAAPARIRLWQSYQLATARAGMKGKS